MGVGSGRIDAEDKEAMPSHPNLISLKESYANEKLKPDHSDLLSPVSLMKSELSESRQLLNPSKILNNKPLIQVAS